MKHYLTFSVMLLLCAQLSFAQQPMFSAPDTVYVNDTVTVTNTSTGGSSYYWSFCAGNLSDTLQMEELPYGAATFTETVRVDGNYYLFISTGYGLSRLSFGNSLLNTPVRYDFGNLGGVIIMWSHGFQIIQDAAGWHLIMVGGSGPEDSRILKVDFGASLDNNFPQATNWGNFGVLWDPVGLYMWEENNQWYGYVTRHEYKGMALLSFGSSFNNPPTVQSLGSFGNGVWPNGMSVVKEQGNYYMFIADEDNDYLTRIDFGTSLLNTNAASTRISLPEFRSPKDVTIFNDCGTFIGFEVGLYPGRLVKFGFPDNQISADSIYADSTYDPGEFSGPYSLSAFSSDGNNLIAFVVNSWTSTMTRLVFPGGNSSSIPSSYQQQAPAFTYTAPGTYRIRLNMDEGLATQQSYCKQIVVLPAPNLMNKVTNGALRIYPVPARDKLYMQFNSQSNRVQYIVVTDMNAKVVYKQQHSLIAGHNKLEILLPASLKSGVYIISDGSHSQQFVLQR